MKQLKVAAFSLLIGFTLAAAGCGGGGSTASSTPVTTATSATTTAAGAVYTMSNDAAGNEIVAFSRAADGKLTETGAFPTGGDGLGAGLDSQNSLIYNAALNRFFAVNAGDSSISMLSLNGDGTLSEIAHVSSGGSTPVSVATNGQTVYVLNAGDGGANRANISGFTTNGNALVPIAGSTQVLSATNPAPDQIGYTPDGQALIVTERGAAFISTSNHSSPNTIDTFPLVGGVAQSGTFQASSGANPFAFEFDGSGHLIVSNVEGGVAGAGTASSYSVSPSLTLTPISSRVASGQTASCWVVLAGSSLYITNNGSSTVSRYSVAPTGALTFVTTSATGAGPIDEAVTADNSFLYLINGTDHTLSFYTIDSSSGALGAQSTVGGLPTHAVGLVAR